MHALSDLTTILMFEISELLYQHGVSANYNYVVSVILSFIIDYLNYLVWIIYVWFHA